MTIEAKAFETPIREGDARILIRIRSILCEVENNAPDFVEVEKDEVSLKIDLQEVKDFSIPELEQNFPVTFAGINDPELSFNFDKGCIWFDIKADHVKDVWVADLTFTLLSSNPRYLAYYIKEVEHQFEWLQPDMKTGEVKTMSISKKKYKTPRISGRESFSSTEVIRCADMLNRAIKKIDIRTRGAYVKFNTDKGKLEPLIIGMADKLGYVVEPLGKDEIANLEASGESASHSIFLKRNF